MIDYKKIGFKCGLEIHQQLETKKLFCNCPSLVNDPHKPDIIVTRRLRAVAGETGEIDRAALYEKKKGKYFIYEACSTSSCLVELDEEPPHDVNQEALDITLMVSMLLNAEIVDEIRFMRKTVVDGSNTSGFQRTALVATNGFIDTSLGKVRIKTICLEEEAAKKIEETADYVKYRLDRLGVPLIELSTAPDIKTGEHAREVASIIGMILRSTNKVKRGIGSIRQDINISIKGGARTELKGFQNLRSIPRVIENEIRRQLSLIKRGIKLKEEVRKVEPDFSTTFLRPMPGAARMYPETDVAPIRISEARLKRIKLPELPTTRLKRFEEVGIPKQLGIEIIKKNIPIESYIKKFKKIKPSLIATTFVITPKEIKKRYNLDTSKLTITDFEEVLSYLNQGKISKEAIIELLIKKIKGENINLADYTISEVKLKKEIEMLLKEKPNLTIHAYMGILMKKYRGKIDGKKVMELLKQTLKHI